MRNTRQVFQQLTGRTPGAWALWARQSATSAPLRLIARANRLTNHAPDHKVAVFGFARSGTTWLAESLLGGPRSVMIWEPLNVAMSKEPRERGFTLLSCLGGDHRDALKRHYLDRLFEARSLSGYLCQAGSAGHYFRPGTVVVKFTNGNTVLPWFLGTFEEIPAILIVRHPCAVVASMLKHPNWTPGRLRSIRRALEAAEQVARFPQLNQVDLDNPATLLAAFWSISNYVPLACVPENRYKLVSYEELYGNEALLAGLRDYAHLPPHSTPQPTNEASYSSEASSISDAVTRWKRQLAPSDSASIQRAVGLFGFGAICRHDRPTAAHYKALKLPEVPLETKENKTP